MGLRPYLLCPSVCEGSMSISVVSVRVSLSVGCKCARGVLPDEGVSGAVGEYMTGQFHINA